MAAYLMVSIAGGILFGVMDGVINANPFAQSLFAVYKPIAKTSVNFIAGILIDLAYGFIMAAVFFAPVCQPAWHGWHNERIELCRSCLVLQGCNVRSLYLDDVYRACQDHPLHIDDRIAGNACPGHSVWNILASGGITDHYRAGG